MNLKSKNGDLVEIVATVDELIIVNNALNEVCNAIEVPEFSARMGADREEVRKILAEIGSIIES